MSITHYFDKKKPEWKRDELRIRSGERFIGIEATRYDSWEGRSYSTEYTIDTVKELDAIILNLQTLRKVLL